MFPEPANMTLLRERPIRFTRRRHRKESPPSAHKLETIRRTPHICLAIESGASWRVLREGTTCSSEIAGSGLRRARTSSAQGAGQPPFLYAMTEANSSFVDIPPRWHRALRKRANETCGPLRNHRAITPRLRTRGGSSFTVARCPCTGSRLR